MRTKPLVLIALLLVASASAADLTAVSVPGEAEIARHAPGPYLVKGVAKGRKRSTRRVVSADVTVTPGRYRAEIHPALNQKDVPEDIRQLLNDAVQSLPEGCRGNLRNFYLQYHDPEQRGLAGKSSMILYGGYDLSKETERNEMRALFIHEFGHITDLGCLRGTETAGGITIRDRPGPHLYRPPNRGFHQNILTDQVTQHRWSKPEHFVSGYAAHDPFEDFSETYAYFWTQRETFAAPARENEALAAKYAWMEANVFAGAEGRAIALSEWSGNVPWDVTKLPYVWSDIAVAVRYAAPAPTL